jgi:hypothetical protein
VAKKNWDKNSSISTRENLSSHASIDQDNVFAEGAFRYVAKGEYTEGIRKGQVCVGKWFKSGIVYDEDMYEKDLKAVEQAVVIIQKFNDAKYLDKLIRINVPQVFARIAGDYKGSKLLVEPYVEDYQKFNSNSGWVPKEANPNSPASWSQAMQALSHFSYHISSGQFLLCDLQGGIYSNGIALSDPVVLSANQRFGPTDLGPKGMSSFFARHQCNRFCRSEWTKPREQFASIPLSSGTSMVFTRSQTHVPTHYSRAALNQPKYYQDDDSDSDDY